MSDKTDEKPITLEKMGLQNNHILTVLLISFAIPLSMSMWIINIIYSKLVLDNEGLDGKYL